MVKNKWIAICYLQKAGDERNKCFFNETELFVITHGREFRIYLELINNITYKNKSLLLPIVAGGLVTSLGLLAWFQNIYFTPYLLFAILGGILLFYFGINGLPALVIQSGNNESHFLLWKRTVNLDVFISYISHYINSTEKSPNEKTFLIPLNTEQVYNLKELGKIKLSKMEVFSFSDQSSININYDYLIKVNPLNLSGQIIFVHHSDGTLKPEISGDLHIEEVEGIYNDIPK